VSIAETVAIEAEFLTVEFQNAAMSGHPSPVLFQTLHLAVANILCKLFFGTLGFFCVTLLSHDIVN
jgi:hypothetical protein